jgi:HK97 gp10 family phage protein
MKTSIRGDELQGSASVGPDKKAFWGLFQEFGTRFSKGNPFIRATFDAGKDKALDAFIVTAKEELRKNGMPIE